MSWIKTTQTIAVQPIAEADAPAFAQGETADKPMPVPNARSANESAAATKAPAITAPHDTPDEYPSFLAEGSGTGRSEACESGVGAISVLSFSS
jgi:hypothetical protein